MLRNEGGTPNVGEDEYYECWNNHCAKVFSASQVKTLSEIEILKPGIVFVNNGIVFSFDRISSSFHKLAKKKAVGEDGVAAELIQAIGIPFCNVFARLVESAWRSAYPPIRWRAGKIVEMLKKASISIVIVIGGFVFSTTWLKLLLTLLMTIFTPHIMITSLRSNAEQLLGKAPTLLHTCSGPCWIIANHVTGPLLFFL